MKAWWHRRSLRVRLAGWYGATGATVLVVSLLTALACGIWRLAAKRDLMLAWLVGLPVGTAVFTMAGYFIAGRALAPVNEMIQRTRRLSAKSLSERLPVANPHDELGQLALLFNAALEQLENSFTELRRFAADASHELRTPLTAMRAVGEVALSNGNPAHLQDAIGSMLEEIRRMNQLIDQLLLLARGDNDAVPVQIEAGMVYPVLMEVREALALVAEEKHKRIEIDCDEELQGVFDRSLLRLALMNLSQNAIRYSPDGARITLRAFHHGGAAVVEVWDAGPGIAPEHHEKIFERFYRVDKARSRADGGAGLGLAIVKWSIERMGGAVELESELGRGSVFRVRLWPILGGSAGGS